MRTTVVIEKQLMETALNLSGLKTKNAVIEAALKLFIQLEQQRQIKQVRRRFKSNEIRQFVDLLNK